MPQRDSIFNIYIPCDTMMIWYGLNNKYSISDTLQPYTALVLWQFCFQCHIF